MLRRPINVSHQKFFFFFVHDIMSDVIITVVLKGLRSVIFNAMYTFFKPFTTLSVSVYYYFCLG